MITKRTFLAVSAAVALLGLSSSAVLVWHGHDRGPRTQAAWLFRAANLPQLCQRADAIVLATAGESQFSRLATSDDGDDTLPFEMTTFQVVQSLRGPQVGEKIYVERTGGWDPVDQTQVVIDADGGAYERGMTYLLFLMQDPTGAYYVQLNDQARYSLQGSKLEAVEHHDPVSELLHGQPLERGLALVRKSMQ